MFHPEAIFRLYYMRIYILEQFIVICFLVVVCRKNAASCCAPCSVHHAQHTLTVGAAEKKNMARMPVPIEHLQ